MSGIDQVNVPDESLPFEQMSPAQRDLKRWALMTDIVILAVPNELECYFVQYLTQRYEYLRSIWSGAGDQAYFNFDEAIATLDALYEENGDDGKVRILYILDDALNVLRLKREENLQAQGSM